MPMVKMKSGKVMKFPYTKKGKAAAKKVAAKKMVHGGGVTKAKAGASIPAAGKSKGTTRKTVKMATGGMVGKIRSSKVVGTEEQKDKEKKNMKGMMGGGAMYGGKKKKGMMGRRSMKDGGQAEKDLKKGDMREVRADMAKKKAAAMKNMKDMKKDRNK